jgi:hypothetical protein
MAGHYTVQETADAAGLGVETLRKYTSCGMTDLVRGEDFYVSRFAHYRRRLYLTTRGLARLRIRSYRVTRQPQPSSGPQFGFMVPPRYNGASMEEQLARIRDTINLIIREYRNHPCAVPNSPCMTHRLGLPQADELASMLSRVREAKAARR